MAVLPILLAAAPAAPGGQMFQTLIFLGAIFAVAYFLILRPQKKKDQQRREMLSRVQRGDHVITIGGIHGEVAAVKDKYVILTVDSERGTTLKMTRAAVHNIVTDATSEEEEPK
jgi:preprotein translocase subunit YajC